MSWRRSPPGMVVAAVGALLRRDPGRGMQALAAEAIDDHLRVLATTHPMAVETGDPHMLKPWLSGQLDFSPAVPTAAGSALALRGAAVGYVFDHKAVGLRLPAAAAPRDAPRLPRRGAALARRRPSRRRRAAAGSVSERGFHAFLWRTSGLGYALVSDSNPAELTGLARSLAAGTVVANAAGTAP